MKIIYKYELEPMNPFVINLPKGAKVLTAGTQKDPMTQEGSIFIWAEVDVNNETEERFFETFGTGWPMHGSESANRRFISTVFMEDLVLHVYERNNPIMESLLSPQQAEEEGEENG